MLRLMLMYGPFPLKRINKKRKKSPKLVMAFKRICFNLSQKVMSTYKWISFVINWHRLYSSLFTLNTNVPLDKELQTWALNTHKMGKELKINQAEMKIPWISSENGAHLFFFFFAKYSHSISIAAKNWFFSEVTC